MNNLEEKLNYAVDLEEEEQRREKAKECNDPAPAFGRFPVKSQAGCMASE